MPEQSAGNPVGRRVRRTAPAGGLGTPPSRAARLLRRWLGHCDGPHPAESPTNRPPGDMMSHPAMTIGDLSRRTGVAAVKVLPLSCQK